MTSFFSGPQLFLLSPEASPGLHLGLGDEAPVVFVDEDAPSGAIAVPDVEVILVPATGLSLAEDNYPEHKVLQQTTF